MTKAEKQAIEKLHNGKKMDLISIIRTFKREGIEKFVVTKKETVETVLNLIEKQNKEIESLKDFKEIAENKVTDLNPIGLARANQLLSRQCHNLQETVENQQAEIRQYDKALHDQIIKGCDIEIELKEEIEKKDKIIDEMAKCMEINGTGRRGFSCMFRGNEECNENGCRTCIKEYFKKKVNSSEQN